MNIWRENYEKQHVPTCTGGIISIEFLYFYRIYLSEGIYEIDNTYFCDIPEKKGLKKND